MRIAMTSVFVDDPVRAHRFYTEVLGFRSRDFNEEAQLAVVVSPEDPTGVALLLEPRGDSFGRDYQRKVFEAGLPAIVFASADLAATIDALREAGVRFRPDLSKPEWGLDNLFEDQCGNLIMLSKDSRT